jgi:hypothetical protein
LRGQWRKGEDGLEPKSFRDLWRSHECWNWTLTQVWNNLKETTNLNLVLKKKNKVQEVKNWKFEVWTL